MDAQALKEHLILHTEDAISVLESIGCHNFKVNKKEIRCALPEHTNSSALALNRNKMSGTIYLPNEEKIHGDFYTLVMHLKKCNFFGAFSYSAKELGMEVSKYYPDKKVEKAGDSIFWLQRKVKGNKRNVNFQTATINRDFMKQYILFPHLKFFQDNISWRTQKKYGICFSPRDNRIIIPHHKWDTGEIIGLFGRTVVEDFKEQDIPKYLGIRPYPKANNLYGLHQNYQEIQEKGYVVVLEAEKSVMQLDTMGEGVGVAVCCHELSVAQRKMLIGLGVEIVIAFDKGVSLEHIKKTIAPLRKYRQCSYIYDDNNLLDNKNSPTDKGYDVWMTLLSERR